MSGYLPDFIQRHYILRNTERYWTNICIVAGLTRSVSKQELSLALRNLILEDGWITQNFFRTQGTKSDDRDFNGKNFVVRPVEEIRFLQVVEYSKGRVDDIENGKLNEVTMPMNSETPLWKLVVYENVDTGSQEICGLFDHSIFDGLASLHFIKRLHAHLNRIEPPKEVIETLFSAKIDGSQISITPYNLDNLPLFSVSLWYRFQRFLWPYIDKIRSYFWPRNPVFATEPTSKRDLANVYRHIKIKQSSKLVQDCRRNGYTLTPFINAIGLLALQETVFTPLGLATNDSRLCIAVNTRPYNGIKPVPKYGVFVGWDVYQLPTVTDIGETAKVLYKKLYQSISLFGAFYGIAMNKVNNVWDGYASLIGKTEKTTVVVSNLGRFVPEKSTNLGNIEIEDIWFSLNTGVVTHFLLNVVSIGDELNIHLGAIARYEPYMDNLKKRIEDLIEEALGEDNTTRVDKRN